MIYGLCDGIYSSTLDYCEAIYQIVDTTSGSCSHPFSGFPDDEFPLLAPIYRHIFNLVDGVSELKSGSAYLVEA